MLTYNWGFNPAGGSPGRPAGNIVDMVIGVFVPGTTATFCEPPGNPGGALNGPVIPGPLTKKAKTSLNDEFTYVVYSSEEKTKLNEATFEEGTKSNSKLITSFTEFIFPADGFEVTDWAIVRRSASVCPLPGWPPSAIPALPIRPLTGPAAIITPELNPIFEF